MIVTQKSPTKNHSTQDKRRYYAFLLDNVGPFPEEISQELPADIFAAIWTEFYYYLNLVAETALTGGGRVLVQYIEENAQTPKLPKLQEITDCLALNSLNTYSHKEGLEFWLNISALLEYGCTYDKLTDDEREQCRRFEYLQELDHFSEIMDLSLLTKHLSRAFNRLSDIQKKSFIQENDILFNKYLGLMHNLTNAEEFYKPIAGRSKYMNLGLERMLGEAAAKRRNCGYTLYENQHNRLGSYANHYYPIKSAENVEAQYKVLDTASIGLIRTNYPYLTLLLTSNAPQALPQDDLKKLTTIGSSLILRYGMELGIAMFDGYVFDNSYAQYCLSLVANQLFKPDVHSATQLKTMSIGPCAILAYQSQKLQYLRIRGNEELDSYLGHLGTKQQREITTLECNDSIKVISVPAAYGLAMQTIAREELRATANEHAENPLAWLMTRFIKPFKIPKAARNILLYRVKPTELDVVKPPTWAQHEIKQLPEFTDLIKQYRNYLQDYKSLEINILYAHLHADRLIDIHQTISIHVGRALKDELASKQTAFKLQPLIDNLHVRDVFDYKLYNEFLAEQGLAADVILTEDSLLLDRIGQGILDYINDKESSHDYRIIFEGNRAMNALFADGTVVQLLDHMDKEGRLSCVTFDMAQVYYRQAPDLFEAIFREDILANYPDSTLGQWFLQYPLKSYHQIMYDRIYTNSDVTYRNRLFRQITAEIRPDLTDIKQARQKRHYVDVLHRELQVRLSSRTKKVVSLYILEGSYDAQFDRYAKIHNAFALPGIDTYRITFSSQELAFNTMCIKS